MWLWYKPHRFCRSHPFQTYIYRNLTWNTIIYLTLIRSAIMLAVIYCEQNLLFVHPDHLCFDRTTYDNINGLGKPLMFNMIGPAGPLMYAD